MIDYDSLYWRVWWSHHDTNNNTDFAARIIPACSSTLGGAAAVALTGSIVMIGLNVTNTPSLQPYEPDPYYAFANPNARYVMLNR